MKKQTRFGSPLGRFLLAFQERGRRLADRFSPPSPDALSPSSPESAELELFRSPGQPFLSWSGKQTQWWYFTGHLTDEQGRELGFELVFFERQAQRDYFGVVPLRFFFPRFFVAHCALVDPGHPDKNRRFRFWQRGGLWDRRPAAASAERFRVNVCGWSAGHDDTGAILLDAPTEGGRLRLDLRPAKPLTFHGDRGFSPKIAGGSISSFYCSCTRLDATGEVEIDGETTKVHGQAWMDIEKMTSRNEMLNAGWDWCSLQFDSGDDLMFYFIRRDNDGGIYSSGTWIPRDGDAIPLNPGDVRLEDLGFWTSQITRGKYPVRRRVSVPSLGLEIEIRPLYEACELDTLRSSCNSYWEGAVTTEGRLKGAPCRGRGYMELVGYDRRAAARFFQLLFADPPSGE